jgi:autotransporter-associated beta strand protein
MLSRENAYRKFKAGRRAKVRAKFAVARPCAAACAAVLFAQGQWAHGGTDSWLGGTSTIWSDGTNWSTGTPPANDLVADIADFDLTTYLNQPNAATTDVSGVQIGDGTTATAPLTISGTQLTLGINGINMMASAGAATFSTAVALGTGQTWTNASSSALTFAGSVTRSAGDTVNFIQTGTGTFAVINSALSNDATGIIGPWATYATSVPSNTGLAYYATVSNGTISAYTGGTNVTSWSALTSSSTNYNETGTAITLTSSISANTILASTQGNITLGTNTMTANGLMMDYPTAGTYTLLFTASGSGGVVIGSSGELVLDVVPNGNALDFRAPIMNNGSTPGSVTVASEGSGSVGFGSSSDLVTNTFSGAFTVNSGYVGLNYTSDPHISTFVINGGTVDLTAGQIPNTLEQLGAGPLVINGGTLTCTSSGPNSSTIGNSSEAWNGNFNLAGTAAMTLDGAITLAKNITINDTNTTTGSPITFTGNIGDGSKGFGITKAGAGYLYLSGSANTFTGPIAVNAGTLQMNSANGSTVTVSSAGTFGVGGANVSVGGINDGTGGGGTVTDPTTSTYTLTLNGSGTYSFSGGVTSTATSGLRILKTGTGVQTFSGSWSDPGYVNIDGGTLYVNNASGSGLGSGAVTVGNSIGGTLGGTGSFSGALSVGALGTVAPGPGSGVVGTLTATSSTTANLSHGNLTIVLNDGSDTASLLSLPNSSATLTSCTLSLLDAGTSNGVKNQTFAILFTGSATSTTFSGLGSGATITDPNGNTYTIAYDVAATGGDDVTLTESSVAAPAPEPASVSLLAVGAFGLLGRRRRRNS